MMTFCVFPVKIFIFAKTAFPLFIKQANIILIVVMFVQERIEEKIIVRLTIGHTHTCT